MIACSMAGMCFCVCLNEVSQEPRKMFLPELPETSDCHMKRLSLTYGAPLLKFLVRSGQETWKWQMLLLLLLISHQQNTVNVKLWEIRLVLTWTYLSCWITFLEMKSVMGTSAAKVINIFTKSGPCKKVHMNEWMDRNIWVFGVCGGGVYTFVFFWFKCVYLQQSL